MSQELTLNATLAYSDSEGTVQSLQISNLIANVSTKRLIRDKMSVGTSDTVIPLGSVTSLGWAMFVNRDPTNYLDIKVAAGGTIIAHIVAGSFAFLFLGSGITAPVAIANVGACQMEYILISQ